MTPHEHGITTSFSSAAKDGPDLLWRPALVDVDHRIHIRSTHRTHRTVLLQLQLDVANVKPLVYLRLPRDDAAVTVGIYAWSPFFCDACMIPDDGDCFVEDGNCVVGAV